MAAYVQYPQLPTYQPIASPKQNEVAVPVPPRDSNLPHPNKHNYDMNFRVHWGPEVSLDIEGLGYSKEQEIARTNALNGVVNPAYFQEESYSAPFFAAIKVLA